MDTPVIFIVFNRPDVTRLVFERIRQAAPKRLFVVADGPRPDRPDDIDRVAATRSVVSVVDWDCEVERDYSAANLGCRRRVSTGISRVFETVEAAIIVEDDCLPDPSFFPYCEELLARYRDDEAVFSISGNNFQNGIARGGGSYYFSSYQHIWGWATWARAWQHYDDSFADWPRRRREQWLRTVHEDQPVARYWARIFESCSAGEIDTWDYPWLYSAWKRRGVAILPNVNLVTNIGFGPDSAHTPNAVSGTANLPVRPMAFPLRHPRSNEPDRVADGYTSRVAYRIGVSDARSGSPRGLVTTVRRWIGRARRFLSRRSRRP